MMVYSNIVVTKVIYEIWEYVDLAAMKFNRVKNMSSQTIT